MKVLRDALAVSIYLKTRPDPSISNLIQTRLAEFAADGYPMEELAFFVIV